MTEQKTNPVVLLRDEKGVYGIGLNEQFPFDQPPFDNYYRYGGSGPTQHRSLILRPDKFPEGEKIRYSETGALLQMIPPRRFRMMHAYAPSLEQRLGGIIALFILHRCGAVDGLRKYHGTFRIAGKILNHMIFQAIEQAA